MNQDQLTRMWVALADEGAPVSKRRRAVSARPRRSRLVEVSVAAGLLAVLVAPLSVAGVGQALREGVRNGTASRETQIIANHDGAATRQSNTGSGLAAIYGCRRDDSECTRHVNLREGPAAHFSTRGGVPFSIDPSATGVVEGLNADKIDGLDAGELAARFGGSAGPPGPAGPQGETGPQGPQGEVGPSGANGATNVVVRERTASHSSVSTLTLDVFCEAGERATGGGGSSRRSTDFQALELSRPGVRIFQETVLAREPTAGETPNAWRIRAENTTGDSREVKAWVICAAP